MMPRLAKIAALFAALAPAIASLSKAKKTTHQDSITARPLLTTFTADGQYTETIGAQEVGSTTIDGTIGPSISYCIIFSPY